MGVNEVEVEFGEASAEQNRSPLIPDDSLFPQKKKVDTKRGEKNIKSGSGIRTLTFFLSAIYLLVFMAEWLS